MQNFLQKFNGSKTYIVALATVAYAATQWWTGNMAQDAAMAMIFGALGLGAVRHGISTQGVSK